MSFPEAFFTLIGESRQKAKTYKFASVEVKETAFRFDGIFLPKTKSDLVYFVEVQFQKLARFYVRLFEEITGLSAREVRALNKKPAPRKN